MPASRAPTRLAHVDDHEAMRRGLLAIIAELPDFELALSAPTIEPVLAQRESIQLVLLDLRLADGSTIDDNLRRLQLAELPALCFTAAEDADGVRRAAAAGALGIVRKSDSIGVLVDSLRRAAAGEPVATIEWAAALDGDPELPAARLSPQERKVLELYASGEKSVSVASATGLSEKTVAEYVRRIRAKYASVGRPAASRIDLYKRAVEDGLVPGPRETA